MGIIFLHVWPYSSDFCSLIVWGGNLGVGLGRGAWLARPSHHVAPPGARDHPTWYLCWVPRRVFSQLVYPSPWQRPNHQYGLAGVTTSMETLLCIIVCWCKGGPYWHGLAHLSGFY